MSSTTPNYGWILPAVNDPTDANLWGGYLNSNLSNQDAQLKTISDAASAAAPMVGEIRIWSTSTAPTKWLFLRGQAVSRATYANLFAVIGTTYGSGDGSTTFNLPDAGGRTVAGQEAVATRLTSAVSGVDGATLGSAGGNQNMQSHTHTATVTDTHKHNMFYNGTSSNNPGDYPGSNENAAVVSNAFSGSFASNYSIVKSTSPSSTPANGVTSGSVQGSITVSNSTTGSGSSQNVQPTIVLNYMIYAGA